MLTETYCFCFEHSECTKVSTPGLSNKFYIGATFQSGMIAIAQIKTLIYIYAAKILVQKVAPLKKYWCDIVTPSTITMKSPVITASMLNRPCCEKTCLRGFANNTGADQPPHPRSLIGTFVICFLESIISRLATS